MDDLRVEGGELKKIVKFARKQPMTFAFNPSSDKENHYFAAHKRKPSKMLGKVAKAEGDSNKVAFGTFEVKGKIITLTVEKPLPKLAKTMKGFFRLNKVNLNVQILDETGNVLEEDIEDLPDDPELDEDDDVENTEEEQSAFEDETDNESDPAALKARLTELQPRILKLEGPLGDKIKPVFKAAVGFMKDRAFDKADKTLTQIEAVLDKQDAAVDVSDSPEVDEKALGELKKRLATMAKQLKELGPDQGAKIKEAFPKIVELANGGKLAAASAGADKLEAALARMEPPSAAPPPPPPLPDATVMKATQMIQAMRTRADTLTDGNEKTGFLADVLRAEESVAAGDGDGAMSILKELAAQWKAMAAAKTARASEEQQGTPDDGPVEELPPEGAEWYREFGKIEAELDEALTQGLVKDVGALRKERDWASAEAGDGRYAEALAKLPQIRALLADKIEDNKTAFSEEIGEDVKPFAEARLTWKTAHDKIFSEFDKLTSAIHAKCSGDPELQVVADNVGDLAIHMGQLDTRLEQKLDKIVNADPSNRDALKRDALSTLEAYEAELGSPFFQAVDGKNGFVNVSVAATAQRALADIGKVLRG